jgi:hypothetical protein
MQISKDSTLEDIIICFEYEVQLSAHLCLCLSFEDEYYIDYYNYLFPNID